MKNTWLFIIVLSVATISCDPSKPISPAAPPGDTTITNIAYAAPEACKVDLYLPGGRTDTTPVIILIHGGGWSSGNKEELAFMANAFQKKGFAVANMNYRLSPQSEDNFKMQLDDIQSLETFLINNASAYIFSKTKYYITGHSAGGHLALSFAYLRNDGHTIKAAASMSAPVNLHNMAYYNPVLYAPLLTPYLGAPLSSATAERYKAASPYYQASATSVPTILFHGGLDLVVNKDQSIAMNARLQELGTDHKLVLYDFAGHDWWTNSDLVNKTVLETSMWFWNH